MKNCGEKAKMVVNDHTQLRFGPGLRATPIREGNFGYRDGYNYRELGRRVSTNGLWNPRERKQWQMELGE